MDQLQETRIAKLCRDDDMLCKGLVIGGAALGATVILGGVITLVAMGILGLKHTNAMVNELKCRTDEYLRTTMWVAGGALVLLTILGLIGTFFAPATAGLGLISLMV